MFCLGAALAFGIPRLFRKDAKIPGPFLLSIALITVAWFAGRALTSPVWELALADLLLLAAAVGCFCWVRMLDGHVSGQRVFHWGIAVLLLANFAVILVQWKNPGYLPLFDKIPVDSGRTGFFTHYIEAANFMVVTSMWTAGAAVWGPHSKFTRIFFGLVAMAGLCGVALSGGRGGVVGGMAAGAVFIGFLLIQGKKQNAKWFAPMVIAVPLLAAASVAFFLFGLKTAVKTRSGGDAELDVTQMMDNNARLLAIGIAWDSIAKHPLAGGGSRSFGWEAFRHSDPKKFGDMTTHRLEYAHNEFLQSTADYGIIGTALVTILLICFGLNCINFTLFGAPNAPPEPGYALRLGGMAALSGLIVQACFAFPFHLIPGAILLGTSLGMIFLPDLAGRRRKVGKFLRTSLAVPLCVSLVLLIWYGALGSLATKSLWRSEYGRSKEKHSAQRLDNIGRALRYWEHSSLYGLRASIYQARADQLESERFTELSQKAIADYGRAAQMHPYEPMFVVNSAHLFSLNEQDQKAEDWFLRAIALQATQEPAFRSHYLFSSHFLGKGMRQLKQHGTEEARLSLELALEQLDKALESMHWGNREMKETRLTILENLALCREANNDWSGAMEIFNEAATLQFGRRANFHVARLQTQKAEEIWKEREPEKALAIFLDAEASLQKARGELPTGTTKEDLSQLRKRVHQSIQFLKRARIQPKR